MEWKVLTGHANSLPRPLFFNRLKELNSGDIRWHLKILEYPNIKHLIRIENDRIEQDPYVIQFWPTTQSRQVKRRKLYVIDGQLKSRSTPTYIHISRGYFCYKLVRRSWLLILSFSRGDLGLLAIYTNSEELNIKFAVFKKI